MLKESSLNSFKKSKMELSHDPVIPLLGIYLKKPKTLIQKNIWTPMFIATLFTIAKIWKKLRCPSVDEWIKKLWAVVPLHNGILLENEENITFWDSMDGLGKHYTKWNKPVRGRQLPYDFTYMWNLMNKIN